METAQLRIPPHSIEAEQSILGALMLDNTAFERVSWLTPNAFYADKHRRVWSAIVGLLERGNPADLVTVCEALGDDLDKAGGAAYLAALQQNTPSALNIHRYAELVRDRAMQREVCQRATEIAEKAIDGMLPGAELAEEAIQAFSDLENRAVVGDATNFGHAIVEAVEWADNPVKGVATGYPALDRIVQGLMEGDLVIVAGRPSMGKTALALNIAEHVAATDPVLVFELEMTRRKIAGRSLRWHESLIGRDDAVDHLSSLKLFIDDSATLTIGQARARARKVQRAHGLKLIVVDYLQLMNAKAENRTQEVSSISRGLKAIAKDLKVPVIAVSQLNRAVETRVDNRPLLSDLRESGQIEQDADVIAFVYREDYYKPDTPWQRIAEVIVRKNREGAIGTAMLDWVPEYTRFKTLERPLPPRNEPEPRAKVKNLSDYKSRAAGDDAAA